MWGNAEWVRLAALACMCRGMYEAARRPVEQPESGPAPELHAQTKGLTRTQSPSTVNPEPPPRGLPPQVEGWKRKAVRAYAEAQDRKWRKWAEAMFEPRR